LKYGTDECKRIHGWAHDSKGCAFDIILKRQINTANAANLKYGLNTSPDREDREEVVTFVENHDMGASPYSPANGWGQQCWPCPPEFKSAAYAFILTMPGTPCVYWPDCFDWGLEEVIRVLASARKKAGIVAGSEWIDLTVQHTGFAGIVKNEKGKPALAVSIKSDFIAPEKEWEIVIEKKGEWTVWRKNSHAD
jgi:alpha-amylase